MAASPALSEGPTNTGEISGIVRDVQGGVLPGPTVEAEHVESGTRTERVTDEHGRYVLPSLRIGTYVVSGELVGFRRLVRDRFPVRLGQTLALDQPRFRGGENLDDWRRAAARVPLGDLQQPQQDQLDLPNRIFGTDNFGRIFSAKNPREMRFGAKVPF